MNDMQQIINNANSVIAAHQRDLDFEKIDRRKIAKWPDTELAKWQSKHPPESPQYILAEHEWQRRLIAEQIKSTRFAAYLSFAGVILGVLIGYYLATNADETKTEGKYTTHEKSRAESNDAKPRPKNTIVKIKKPVK